MIQYLMGVLCLIGVASCEPKKEVPPPEPTPSPDAIIIETPDSVSVPAPSTPVATQTPTEAVPSGVQSLLTTDGLKLVGANTAQSTKYAKAIEVFKKVIKDPEFKKRVLAHKKLNGSLGFENTTDTPAKVYEKLLQASETFKKAEIDHDVDIEVRFYYANNSTVGYTYPNVGYINVNTKFFDGYKPNSVAANLLHEYMHKLGYGHDSARTTRRPYSVPYGMGSIMSSLGAKYL